MTQPDPTPTTQAPVPPQPGQAPPEEQAPPPYAAGIDPDAPVYADQDPAVMVGTADGTDPAPGPDSHPHGFGNPEGEPSVEPDPEPEPDRPSFDDVAAEISSKVGEWHKAYADVAWRGEFHKLIAPFDAAAEHFVVRAEEVARDTESGALDKVHLWVMRLPDPPFTPAT